MDEYEPLHPFMDRVTWDTIVCVPLTFRDRAVGVLVVYRAGDEGPTAEEITFLQAIADQAAVAVENARLFAETQDKAALEERQRLARELHDSVSQALFSIALHARTALALLTRDPERLSEPLEHITSLAQAGMAEMRALIFELRPESLENEGLVAALTKQVAALRARYGIEVHAELGDEPPISIDAKEVIYRVAQESMHNTLKHARATRIDLRLDHSQDAVWVEIRDNGVGFDPTSSFPGHLGLHSMRERAIRRGGTFQIESDAGKGTRIRVELPL
jgi:signal transduction histidine kinase